MHFNHLDNQDIALRLQDPEPDDTDRETPLPGLAGAPTPAAVLLPLFRADDRWRVLFIRRAVNRADRHSGEVAFPGGRVEPGDSHSTAAALREAREEIDLQPGQVQLLGRLPPYRSASNYLITPVVGRIPWPVALRPDRREVARIFSIPLDWLAQADNHEIRAWRPPGHDVTRQVVYFREFDGERLWGVSARITLRLLESLQAQQR
jgi:8-oxo-dGTP pyrophosphatase MutT (NUDIX family)